MDTMDTMLSVCHHLGIPIAAEKWEGPSSEITFLSIRFDTEKWQLCLPEDKLHELLSELSLWNFHRGGAQKESYCP